MDEIKIKNNMLKQEKFLSKYASFDSDSIRLKEYNLDPVRPNYFRDADRIIYTLSYNRYIDKTQVFSDIKNDHVSKRMIHVQLVSKIARTIGRALNLNEDLIEAIALGHDIGHCPYGHVGEKILNKISIQNNEGIFMHNVQSVRTLMYLEKNGEGVNLSIQVLDGILCHNGEILEDTYYPVKKSKEEFLKEYEECFKSVGNINKLHSMTLEGCVVRISDVIAYIGRDLEDATRMNILKLSDIPKNISKTLGTNNSEIVNSLVNDIIDNSIDKNYIKMSKKISNALNELIKFNYENIYEKIHTEEDIKLYEKKFNKLFSAYMNDLNNNNFDSSIYINYLDNMNDFYKNNNTKERIVIDYIAGMTDDYFNREYEIVKEDNYEFY